MAEAWTDYFDEDEELLWEGAPKRQGRITLAMLGAAIFGAPFLLAGLATSIGGLAVLLGYEIGWASAGGIFAFLFGLPFIGVGGGLVFGPYYMAVRAHRNVRYALSDRRAYIASQWWTRKMEVLTIAKDAPVTVEAERSVFFHTVVGTDSEGDRTTDRKGFENIEDALAVYRLLRNIQAKAE